MKTAAASYSTLSEALEAHIQSVHSKGGIFLEDPFEMYTFAPSVPYQTSWADSRELASLKGKKTKAFAHSSIYRLESGRYELVSYIA